MSDRRAAEFVGIFCGYSVYADILLRHQAWLRSCAWRFFDRTPHGDVRVLYRRLRAIERHIVDRAYPDRAGSNYIVSVPSNGNIF